MRIDQNLRSERAVFVDIPIEVKNHFGNVKV